MSEHWTDLVAELLRPINDYAVIESPYRKIKGGRVIDYDVLVVTLLTATVQSRPTHGEA